MEKLLVWFLAITCPLFAGCSLNSGNEKAIETIEFPESGTDTLKISYFSDTVVYVPLETTNESFIDMIDQLWMDDSVILLSTARKGLLMFRNDGKYVRMIGKQGRGPGEYVSIVHFDVFRDTIYVSSMNKRGFLRYTFDGTFCDEVKLNFQPRVFNVSDDQKLVCYDQHSGKLFVYDNSFDVPDSIIVEYGVTEGRYRYSYRNSLMTFFQNSRNGLLFNSYLSDTLWNISANRKEPVFVLGINEELLPYDKQIEFCNGDLQGWEAMSGSYNYYHLIPYASGSLIFQSSWNASSYSSIYINSIVSGVTTKYNTSFIVDDMVSQQKISDFYYIYFKDYLVA